MVASALRFDCRKYQRRYRNPCSSSKMPKRHSRIESGGLYSRRWEWGIMLTLRLQKNCDCFQSISGESRSKKSSSIRGILSLGGHRSLSSTRNALARQSNSKSETQRSCVSILARVCRLKSHPHRRQRAASIGCVRPCWSRKRRICGPTRFRGFFFMFRFRNLKTRQPTIFKGSEFRTLILLALKPENARHSSQ